MVKQDFTSDEELLVYYRKYKKHKRIKWLSFLIVLIVGGFLAFLYFNSPDDPNPVLVIKTTEAIEVELGEPLEFNIKDYVDTTGLSEEQLNDLKMNLVAPAISGNGNVDLEVSREVDQNSIKTGTYALVFTLGEEQAHLDVHVKDTTAPEFTKSKDAYEFEEGTEKPDFKVDYEASDLSGEVEITIDASSLDMSKPGEYNLKAIAEDTSGNKAEKEFKVTITEKKEETPSSSNSSSSGGSSSGGSSGSSSSKPSGGNSGGSSTPPPSQYFLFSDGYNMQNVSSACAAALNQSGKAGICVPLQDEEGIYYGMRLDFY